MFYIIYGDDNYRCQQTLNEIKGGLGSSDMLTLNTTRLDGRKLTFKELKEVCDVVPFMSASRLVVVEGLLKRFQSGERQARTSHNDGAENNQQLKEWNNLADYVKEMPQSTVLIVFDTDLDSRGNTLMVKNLSPAADNVLQFNELKGKELQNWIKEYAARGGVRISTAAVNLLDEYIGGDLWALTGELDKLTTYCSGREITDSDVREITSFAREESIFSLVDAVIEGRIKEAQSMLHRMLKYGTAPQQILVMIDRQLAVILRVKEMSHKIPPQEIKKRLGLHPRYPLEKTLKQAGSFTIPRLRKAFHALLDTDVAIKTGKYEGDLALDLLVTELCRVH